MSILPPSSVVCLLECESSPRRPEAPIIHRCRCLSRCPPRRVVACRHVAAGLTGEYRSSTPPPPPRHKEVCRIKYCAYCCAICCWYHRPASRDSFRRCTLHTTESAAGTGSRLCHGIQSTPARPLARSYRTAPHRTALSTLDYPPLERDYLPSLLAHYLPTNHLLLSRHHYYSSSYHSSAFCSSSSASPSCSSFPLPSSSSSLPACPLSLGARISLLTSHVSVPTGIQAGGRWRWWCGKVLLDHSAHPVAFRRRVRPDH